jgi:hypothetical protein
MVNLSKSASEGVVAAKTEREYGCVPCDMDCSEVKWVSVKKAHGGLVIDVNGEDIIAKDAKEAGKIVEALYTEGDNPCKK